MITFINHFWNEYFQIFNQAVESDLKVAAKARKEVESQAQRMLAQGMETQVNIHNKIRNLYLQLDQ